MQYAVVEFRGGNYDVVPYKWLFDECKKTYWPSCAKADKITTAVNRISDPDGTWKIHKVKEVHGLYETVLEARQKLVRMDNDVETSDPNGKRRRKPTKHFESPPIKSKRMQRQKPNSLSCSSDSSLPSVPNSIPSFQDSPSSPPQSTSLAKQKSPSRLNETAPVEPRRKLNFGSIPTTSTSASSCKSRPLELVGSEQKFRESVLSSLAYLKMKMDQLHDNQSQIQERLEISN
ncbi:unnamed protein product [Allacma fusca]|uniref:Uncharacterized protein n=1 Tax=Allacma fusca TaxID=39272 RepID=A0A8J2NFX4_9HEXA|nr:unnamed protein product [Allacma fusca]